MLMRLMSLLMVLGLFLVWMLMGNLDTGLVLHLLRSGSHHTHFFLQVFTYLIVCLSCAEEFSEGKTCNTYGNEIENESEVEAPSFKGEETQWKNSD